MSLMNTKGIGSVCLRNRRKREYKPMMRLLDHISVSTQELIWVCYKEGISRRRMSMCLLELGVPSPPMQVPWGDSAIRVVVEKYKKLEAINGQAQEVQ